jgi:hypothetical protein
MVDAFSELGLVEDEGAGGKVGFSPYALLLTPCGF